MSDNGSPLRIIQEVSGHRDLSQLQNYLEVQDSQVLGAVASLSMLSPVGDEVGKYGFNVAVLQSKSTHHQSSVRFRS
jgi:integrase/recombinase XerD